MFCGVQHLVKDQRVLKLVQRLAEKEEGGGGGGEKGESHTSDDWEELTAYVGHVHSRIFPWYNTSCKQSMPTVYTVG